MQFLFSLVTKVPLYENVWREEQRAHRAEGGCVVPVSGIRRSPRSESGGEGTAGSSQRKGLQRAPGARARSARRSLGCSRGPLGRSTPQHPESTPSWAWAAASSHSEPALGHSWGPSLKGAFHLSNTPINVSLSLPAILFSEDTAMSKEQGQKRAVRETEQRPSNCV